MENQLKKRKIEVKMGGCRIYHVVSCAIPCSVIGWAFEARYWSLVDMCQRGGNPNEHRERETNKDSSGSWVKII